MRAALHAIEMAKVRKDKVDALKRGRRALESAPVTTTEQRHAVDAARVALYKYDLRPTSQRLMAALHALSTAIRAILKRRPRDPKTGRFIKL